jgi:hypothetical protein
MARAIDLPSRELSAKVMPRRSRAEFDQVHIPATCGCSGVIELTS